MMIRLRSLCIALTVAGYGWAARTPSKIEQPVFDPNAVNEATLSKPVRRGASRAAVIKLRSSSIAPVSRLVKSMGRMAVTCEKRLLRFNLRAERASRAR